MTPTWYCSLAPDGRARVRLGQSFSTRYLPASSGRAAARRSARLALCRHRRADPGHLPSGLAVQVRAGQGYERPQGPDGAGERLGRAGPRPPPTPRIEGLTCPFRKRSRRRSRSPCSAWIRWSENKYVRKRKRKRERKSQHCSRNHRRKSRCVVGLWCDGRRGVIRTALSEGCGEVGFSVWRGEYPVADTFRHGLEAAIGFEEILFLWLIGQARYGCKKRTSRRVWC